MHWFLAFIIAPIFPFLHFLFRLPFLGIQGTGEAIQANFAWIWLSLASYGASWAAARWFLKGSGWQRFFVSAGFLAGIFIGLVAATLLPLVLPAPVGLFLGCGIPMFLGSFWGYDFAAKDNIHGEAS